MASLACDKTVEEALVKRLDYLHKALAALHALQGDSGASVGAQAQTQGEVLSYMQELKDILDVAGNCLHYYYLLLLLLVILSF